MHACPSVAARRLPCDTRVANDAPTVSGDPSIAGKRSNGRTRHAADFAPIAAWRRHGQRGAAPTLATPAIAQTAPLKIGLMLPFSGTFAALGENIAAAFDMHVKELGGKMGGRAGGTGPGRRRIGPAKAPSNVNRLLGREKAEVLIGTVHSGVVMALVQAAREQEIPLIIPNAGNVAATRELCAPSVFRSSFSNWQPAYGMGKALAAQGREESRLGHLGLRRRQGIRRWLPRRSALRRRRTDQGADLAVPRNEFPAAAGADCPASASTRSARSSPAAARSSSSRTTPPPGCATKLPLCGSGFLTEGVLKPQGAAAEGMQTALHYGDGLDNPKNIAFRAAFKAFTSRDADVYAVQGYDAAQMLAIGLAATKGDAAAVKDFAAAIRARRSTARAARSRCRPRTIRCRRSGCARRRTARTVSSARRPRRWPIPAPAAR